MKNRNTSPSISEELRQTILDSGESLAQIGIASGVDHGLLSRFMRGERAITTRTLDRLCEHLGLHLEPRKSRQKGR